MPIYSTLPQNTVTSVNNILDSHTRKMENSRYQYWQAQKESCINESQKGSVK